MQYHDEIVVRVKEKNINKAVDKLTEAMYNANLKLKLNEEIKCDTANGKSYADIH